MTAPNLASVIESPTVRRWIYGTYTVAVVAVGATQAGYASLEQGQPAWLTATLAVLAYLGVAVGGLAIANTPGKTTAPTYTVNVNAPRDHDDPGIIS